MKGCDEIRELVDSDAGVIAIDEVQFFSEDVVALADELAEAGHRVICAGLDMDFRGEPFGPIPHCSPLLKRSTNYRRSAWSAATLRVALNG